MGGSPIAIERAVVPMTADARSARPRWSCPEPEVLAAFADGRLDDRTRTRLEEHVADCDACLADVGLLARAADAPVPPVPDALLQRALELNAPARQSVRPWVAAAAILVLVTSALLIQLRPPSVIPPSDAPELRGLAATDLLVIEPPEGGTLPRERAMVRWNRVPRALSYEVRLTDRDGTLAWEARTEETNIAIPAAVLRSFSSGFLWVTAHQPDNRSVRSRAIAVSAAPR